MVLGHLRVWPGWQRGLCPVGPGMAAGEGARERGRVMSTVTISLKVWERVAKPFAVPMGELEEVWKAPPRSAAPKMYKREGH